MKNEIFLSKPKEFFAIHNDTKEIRYFDGIEFAPYHFSGTVYPWTIYVDTRYPAKIRLWRYINKIPAPKYQPFKGTEIGKSIPILNF